MSNVTANPQLVEYLRQVFQLQKNEIEVRAKLVASGWSEFDIGLAWQAAQSQSTPLGTANDETRSALVVA